MGLAVQCRILGPVLIEVGDVPVALSRRRVRHLLALLLLDVGRPLPAQRLVDLLWPDSSPANPRAALQAVVSRLRASLATVDGVELVRRGDGYAIETDPEIVDAYRFRRLVERAEKSQDPATRAELARQALSLWRGPALADVSADAARNAMCARLAELRQHAIDLRIGAELELGRHEALVGELTELIADDPLNERVVAHLVLALYRSGRRADALAACRQARADLADQLGLDPGSRLRELELAVLRADPALDLTEPVPSDAAQPVSAQLPPGVADFTGRSDQLAELDRFAETARGAMGVTVICGLAGAGKTALALHWAHTVRERYPDGQLFLDLRGYAPEPPVRPIDALGVLLRGLAVRPEDVPADLAEATALLRTVLSGRRVLLVLDNARDAGQVRVLFPGAAGCHVVITSRDRLSGLVARDGARQLTLGALSPAESLALLRQILGEDRVAAEPAVAAELAEACGRLPLALRIAAANLADRPDRSVADHVAELRSTPGLAALEVAGDSEASTRAAFDLSYRVLADGARRLFRLLALAPGPDLSLPGAAALAAVAPEQAEPLLTRLNTAHLVQRLEPARYLMHDLVRRYAAELAAAAEPAPERAVATRRLLDFYLYTVDAAVAVVCPQVARLPLPPSAAARLSFADHHDAHGWLQRERPNLVAAVRHAAEHGPGSVAWLLADRLRGYFWISRHMADWLASAEAGLAAATAGGAASGLAAMHLSLGIAHRSLGHQHDAIEHLRRSLELSREAGWVEGEAGSLGSLGVAFAEAGRNRAAIEHFTSALAMNRQLGRRGGEAVVLSNLGNLRLELGDLREAARDLTAALETYRDVRSPGGEAIALANRGLVQLQLGRLDAAMDDLARSLARHEETGDRYGLPYSLSGLAIGHCAAGRFAEARECAGQALTIARETGDRRGELAAVTALGDVARGLGAGTEAMGHYRQARQLADEHGYRYEHCEALVRLAEAYLRTGEPDRALAEATGARKLAQEASFAALDGQAATVIAGAYLARGAFAEAVRHASEALAAHQRTGFRQAETEARAVLEQAQRGPAG